MSPTVTISKKTGLKVIRGKVGRDLLRAAEQAYTPAAREKLEKQLEKLVGNVEWKVFGGSDRAPHARSGQQVSPSTSPASRSSIRVMR